MPRTGLFLGIQHLTIIHHYEDNDRLKREEVDVMTGVRNFGQLCGPELRSITVEVPLLKALTGGELAFAFGAYPHVEEITIRGGQVPNGDTCAEVAKAIASRCQNLQKLEYFDKPFRFSAGTDAMSLHIEWRAGEEIAVSRSL